MANTTNPIANRSIWSEEDYSRYIEDSNTSECQGRAVVWQGKTYFICDLQSDDLGFCERITKTVASLSIGLLLVLTGQFVGRFSLRYIQEAWTKATILQGKNHFICDLQSGDLGCCEYIAKAMAGLGIGLAALVGGTFVGRVSLRYMQQAYSGKAGIRPIAVLIKSNQHQTHLVSNFEQRMTERTRPKSSGGERKSPSILDIRKKDSKLAPIELARLSELQTEAKRAKRTGYLKELGISFEKLLLMEKEYQREEVDDRLVRQVHEALFGSGDPALDHSLNWGWKKRSLDLMGISYHQHKQELYMWTSQHDPQEQVFLKSDLYRKAQQSYEQIAPESLLNCMVDFLVDQHKAKRLSSTLRKLGLSDEEDMLEKHCSELVAAQEVLKKDFFNAHADSQAINIPEQIKGVLRNCIDSSCEKNQPESPFDVLCHFLLVQNDLRQDYLKLRKQGELSERIRMQFKSTDTQPIIAFPPLNGPAKEIFQLFIPEVTIPLRRGIAELRKKYNKEEFGKVFGDYIFLSLKFGFHKNSHVQNSVLTDHTRAKGVRNCTLPLRGLLSGYITYLRQSPVDYNSVFHTRSPGRLIRFATGQLDSTSEFAGLDDYA